MKKNIILAFLSLTTTFLFAQNKENSQSYKSALGLRVSSYGNAGFNYKYFKSDTKAIDAVLSTNFDNGMTLTVLYELHTPVVGAQGLFWYYGLGGHVGAYGRNENSVFHFGLDGVLGLEYVIKEIPFAISLDYLPSFNIRNYNAGWNDRNNQNERRNDAGFIFDNFTIGIKYTFGKTLHQEKK
jgi:hypothetical protein